MSFLGKADQLMGSFLSSSNWLWVKISAICYVLARGKIAEVKVKIAFEAEDSVS